MVIRLLQLGNRKRIVDKTVSQSFGFTVLNGHRSGRLTLLIYVQYTEKSHINVLVLMQLIFQDFISLL